MAHLRLCLLGSPQVWCGEQALAFPTRKALALLVYLAVEGGSHSREKLTALLWPESDAARGRGSLRTALAFLRQAFDAAPTTAAQSHLLIEPDTLGFDFTSAFELDLHLVAAALKTQAVVSLQAAADLYRGDFLEGFSLPDAPTFDDWVTFQREHWRQQMRTVFERLSQQQMAGRDLENGITTAVRWLAHDPLHESAHRRLMQLHFLAGNRAAALQAYQSCRAVLAEELGVQPSPETEALVKRIRDFNLTIDDSAAQNPNRQLLIANRQWIIPFVGRTQEHTQLAAIYQAAGQGQAQVVAIQGEAGIGKTRLALEFLAWATAQGADVLRGRAFEAGGRLPYQPLVEALRRRLEQENAPDDLLSDVWLAELGRLLPELRDRYPDLPLPTHDETLARTRLLEAVARLGQALAARRPVILFLDDGHWADAASLDVLHYCGRVWTESHTPILLILTIRSEALATTPALDEWLSGLGRDVTLTRLALRPISASETQKLVEALAGVEPAKSAATPPPPGFPASFARWLFGETEGQPFYISEMIKTLLEQGLLQLHLAENGAWMVEWRMAAPPSGLIPPGVREVILTRLRRLTANATALLTAAAVIGRDCSFERMCQVAGVAAGEGLPALDELLAGRLLLETDDPARPYAFAHDKIRDVVYTEAGAARRRLYHRQAFAALEAGGAPPAELAHHALAAQLAQPAFDYCLAAGDAAMALFAVRDAIVHYQQARQQLTMNNDQLPISNLQSFDFAEPKAPYGQDKSPISNLYLGLGRAYELVGDHPQAQTVYQEMLALAQTLDQPDLTCAALNRLGTLATHAYQFEAAAVWLKEAIAVAEAGGNKAALAQTEWSLAQLAYHTFDYPATVLHGQRSLALARQLADPALIAGSLNTLAYAEALLGQVQASQIHMEEAITLYVKLGNKALEADCLAIMAVVKMEQGQLEASIADARAAYRLSQEIDNPWGQLSSGAVLAFSLMDKGELAEALAIARQGRQRAQAHDLVLVSFLNLLVLGMVHRALLDPAAARAVHLAAAALGERTQSESLAEMAAAQLCSDCALAGDWEEAARYAREALAARKYTALPLVIPPLWPETEALLRAGELDLAREDARRWDKLAGHIPRYRLPLLRSLAVLAEGEGDTQQAVAHLQAALSLAEDIGLPGEQWQILARLGELYQAIDSEEKARPVSKQAAEIIQTLAAKIDDEGLRAGFLAAESIRRVKTFL